MGYKRGFSSADFVTEQQHQQMGVAERPSQRPFGAALPFAVNPLDFNPNEEKSKDWRTTSHSSFKPLDEQPAEWKPGKNMSNEQLKTYREKFSSERSEIGRKLRFETESERSLNTSAADHLKSSRLRLIPGAPLSLEKFRKSIMETYGVLAIPALRCALNMEAGATASDDFLRELFTKLSVKLTSIEFAQIMAYLTQTEIFEKVSLLNSVSLNPVANFQEDVVRQRFFSLFGTEQAVSLEKVYAVIDADRYPELFEGVVQFLPSYGEDIGIDQFVDFHRDMARSSATAELYSEVLELMWV